MSENQTIGDRNEISGNEVDQSTCRLNMKLMSAESENQIREVCVCSPCGSVKTPGKLQFRGECTFEKLPVRGACRSVPEKGEKQGFGRHQLDFSTFGRSCQYGKKGKLRAKMYEF